MEIYDYQMRRLRLSRLWLAIGGILIALVALLSLIPSPSDAVGFTGMDKLIHMTTYGFLMFWFGLIFRPGRVYMRMGIFLVMLGLILELIQRMVS